ncbi:MAG: hypothetical protein M3Q91_11515 [Acidobacteriota bacterium]|nr:hypothetical protein [Acidobacteriota bacterium]
MSKQNTDFAAAVHPPVNRSQHASPTRCVFRAIVSTIPAHREHPFRFIMSTVPGIVSPIPGIVSTIPDHREHLFRSG